MVINHCFRKCFENPNYTTKNLVSFPFFCLFNKQLLDEFLLMISIAHVEKGKKFC